MSIDSIFTGYEVVTVLSVTIAVSIFLWWRAARSRRRLADLLAARTALEAHYEAVEAVLEDPALPDRARLFISKLTLAISDEETAERIVYACMRGTLFKKKPGPLPYANEMADLQKTRPDLVRNFDRAVDTGIMALTLRWPASAKMFQMMVTMLAADERRKFEVANDMISHDARPTAKRNHIAAAGAC